MKNVQLLSKEIMAICFYSMVSAILFFCLGISIMIFLNSQINIEPYMVETVTGLAFSSVIASVFVLFISVSRMMTHDEMVKVLNPTTPLERPTKKGRKKNR